VILPLLLERLIAPLLGFRFASPQAILKRSFAAEGAGTNALEKRKMQFPSDPSVDYFASRDVFSDPVIAPLKKRSAPSSVVYQLKITLRGSKPPIWRRLQVPGNIKLNRLHEVFQAAMGWADSHLHQFIDPPVIYSVPSEDDFPGVERLDERRFHLADLVRREKASFLYEYDFGDSWVHHVVVEKIVPAGPEKKRAICLAGKKACPPEDCGGIWGYYELLEVLNDSTHESHQEMLDWLGEPFNPDRFDLQEVNDILGSLKF